MLHISLVNILSQKFWSAGLNVNMLWSMLNCKSWRFWGPVLSVPTKASFKMSCELIHRVLMVEMQVVGRLSEERRTELWSLIRLTLKVKRWVCSTLIHILHNFGYLKYRLSWKTICNCCAWHTINGRWKCFCIALIVSSWAISVCIKKYHSTETALVRVKNDIIRSIAEQKVTMLILLDLSAAFDTVDHKIHLDRCRDQMGIGGDVQWWLSSYLSDRTQCVSIMGSRSEAAQLSYGAPQGSVLGPLLFGIYTSPFGDIISKHGVKYHQYADDTQLYMTFKLLDQVCSRYFWNPGGMYQWN